MRNRVFAVLAIAILAGGGLAYGTYNLVQNQPQQTATPGEGLGAWVQRVNDWIKGNF